jgi:predicted RNA-binding protein with PUA-like domain
MEPNPMTPRCWLLTSEPGEFSLEDLRSRPHGTAPWDGVRNYQARNSMRDSMRTDDRVLFYHSGKHPAVVGTARVAREGYPDNTAWDPASAHPDPRSTPDHPVWFMVDIAFEAAFPRPVPLSEMRTHPGLKGLLLLRKGNRLSVMPVAPQHCAIICRLGGLTAGH